MNWIILGATVVAVLLTAGTVWAFKLGAPLGLDAVSAKHEAEAAIAGFEAVDAAVASDAQAALVEGRIGYALVRSHGANNVVRPVLASQIHIEGDSLIIDVGEAMFGRTTLDLDPGETARWIARLGS